MVGGRDREGLTRHNGHGGAWAGVTDAGLLRRNRRLSEVVAMSSPTHNATVVTPAMRRMRPNLTHSPADSPTTTAATTTVTG
jgi:hypothetical protein